MPQVVLHTLLQLVHLVNKDLFELRRVDLWVLLGASPRLSCLRNFLDRVNGLGVCVLGADESCLREVLP